MERVAGKAGELEKMPVRPVDRMVVRPSDGRRMPATFRPVAIVHDAGEWFFYEEGDEIPPNHRTAGEKEAEK